MKTSLFASCPSQPSKPLRSGAAALNPCASGARSAAARPGLKTASRHGRGSAGFTLVELMIAVAVTSVLSSVAYPSFMGQVQKVRRSDALVAMMQVQWAQERWRANNTTYGSLSDIGVAGSSAARHYTLQLRGQTENGYEVIATAIGAQARDAQCRHMKLSMSGANTVYVSGPDAGTVNPDTANRQCWML
ncbi:MAG: prepilin-type N-terminal cleavage/methylation domain-containing protein [Rhizobacter sp.]|nr:prepilin-type N-terminal cleavage/methylation domain-containing protein [Rhizobacter sp.]